MSQTLNPRYLKLLIVDSVLAKKGILARLVLSIFVLFIATGLTTLLFSTMLGAISDKIKAPSLRLIDLMPGKFSEQSEYLRFLNPLVDALRDITVTQAQVIFYLPLLLLINAVVQAAATYTFQLNQQALVLHVGSQYRDKLFAAILKQPYARLLNRSAGEWMSLVMNDITYLQSRMSDLIIGLLKDSVSVIAPVVILYFIDWRTALVLTVLCIPLMFGTGKTGKRISHYAEAWQRNLAKMASAVLEIRRRFEFIRAQKGEKVEYERFQEINQAYYSNIKKSIFIRSAFAPGLELFGFVMLAAIVYLIGQGFMGRDLMNSNSVTPFLITLAAILKPLRTIGEQISRLQETKGILGRSLQTFASVEEFEAKPPRAQLQSLKTLDIEALSVSYGDGFLLKAEGLHLKAGESVAIIGPSGGGKSTLLKCVAGLYPSNQWRGSLPWETLRDNACLVSQKPFLFSGSLRENLCYGLDTVSEERLTEALSFVSLSQELEAKGQTLDTEIDFLQSPLSGGQMQRLTIARGFIRPHSILLMDEVTSAIDPAAEESITRRVVIRAKEEGRILLYVTHRLSQLEIFDQLWFCEQGQVTVFKDPKKWQTNDRVQQFIEHEKRS